MVSQHGGDVSTSLTLRGPSSVVGTGSRSTTGGGGSHLSSRARRYNRSHAGGTSFIPQNEFPIFSHSGDVEIVVRVPSGHENRYLLHRHTLTRCSGFFEASTSNEWSRAQTVPANVPELPALPATTSNNGAGTEVARIDDNGNGRRSNDGPLPTLRKRWRYELDPGTGDDDIPMLVQKEEINSPPASSATAAASTSNSIFGGPPPNDSRSSSRHYHSSSQTQTQTSQKASFFSRSVANLSLSHHHHHHHQAPPVLPPPSQADQDLLRDYDNMFRIMYNYPPYLDGINIADAYVQCKSLLSLADQYDALAVVGPRIAKYPISYLRLGYLARSKVIFQEALIHVVGQWPAGERSIRAALPESVLDIIEDKVDELEETVSRIEARLFRLTLTNRSSGERVTPATNYLDWLAVSLFRQWLADNTTPPPLPLSLSSSVVVPDRTRSGHRADLNNGSSRNRGGSSGSESAGGGQSRGHHHVGRQQQQTQTQGPPPLAVLGRTYRVLGGGPGDKSYLGHDECKRFLKLTPDLYSRDNLRRFEKRVDELKAMAREVVHPLMGSGLELEMGDMTGVGGGGGYMVGYLTCTTVGDRDLPWDVYD
ncbi:hypothetical protein B0H66DRAFT_576892 [Apodospora peruviana]|uniref:BTB domain-containing protein n=1 Tax=Apodospora peruviana TaxID=516989 RepID=A0AAE0M0W6_9PEZI|nr:hypothetical protein B0H66DRAFT_576892 [Apodospora peruviana]